MDSPNTQYPDTVVTTNKKAPPLEGGNSIKMGVVWTLKHEIFSTRLYQLIINREIKLDTALGLNNF